MTKIIKIKKTFFLFRVKSKATFWAKNRTYYKSCHYYHIPDACLLLTVPLSPVHPSPVYLSPAYLSVCCLSACGLRLPAFLLPFLVMSNQRFFKIVCFRFPTNVPKKIEYIRFLNKIQYRTKTFSSDLRVFGSKAIDFFSFQIFFETLKISVLVLEI
jgi:hypothetical protein